MEISFDAYRIYNSEKQEKKAKFYITYSLMLTIKLEVFPDQFPLCQLHASIGQPNAWNCLYECL